MKYAFAAFALVTLSMFCIDSHAAFSCTMIGNADASVQLGQGTLSLPLWNSNCEGSRVVAGSVTVCYRNQSERLICRPFSKGQAIREKNLPSGGTTLHGYLTLLDHLARGDASSDSLGVRGVGTLPGLPYNEILGLGSTQQLDLVRAGLSPADWFELRAGEAPGTLILRVDHPADTIRFDTRRLKRGQSYTWIIQVKGTTLSGQFQLAYDKELSEARKQLYRLGQDRAAGPTGIAMLQAQWLLDRNFIFDADETLQVAGLKLKR